MCCLKRSFARATDCAACRVSHACDIDAYTSQKPGHYRFGNSVETDRRIRSRFDWRARTGVLAPGLPSISLSVGVDEDRTPSKTLH
jgi:hypothetical protein